MEKLTDGHRTIIEKVCEGALKNMGNPGKNTPIDRTEFMAHLVLVAMSRGFIPEDVRALERGSLVELQESHQAFLDRYKNYLDDLFVWFGTGGRYV